MSRSRPLALGLIHLPASTLPTERAQARIALSLYANDEGYALVETFEVDSTPMKDAAALRALEGFATQLDATAVIVSGSVKRQKVEEIAERVRMMVIGPRAKD